MFKRILGLLLSAALLSGCASMLSRSYVTVEPHDKFSDTGTNSSALRAETYQGLINAILYLISHGEPEGVIRLYNYTGDAESDLSSACLEVTQEDPLGAYAVDYIKYDLTRIVSYHEAKMEIAYRRTPEQIGGVTAVTGSSAIKDEIRQALLHFLPETVLQVIYLTEDEEYIAELVRRTYYDTPETAFGVPELSVTLYPDSGTRRIVEMVLSYPGTESQLREMREILSIAAQALAEKAMLGSDVPAAAIFQLLRERAVYEGPHSPGLSTAYSALVDGRADSEGYALAYSYLCRLCEIECIVVEGVRAGNAHFWNIIKTEEGWRHVAAGWGEGLLLTDDDMAGAGYSWDADLYPACVKAPENST